MKNRMVDLRNHLFATLESLQDPDNPMDLDRAKTIADVAQTLINSAKVEVDFLRATEQHRGTGFLDVDRDDEPKRLTAVKGY